MVVLLWINKIFSACFELVGRLVFNSCPVEVGGCISDVRYGGESRKQSLDIYIPQGEGPFPVFVYTHGGGFHTMGRRSYTRLAMSYAHEGYLVFNVDYRLAPAHKYREQFADVGEALRYAYEHASEYGGDNSRMFIGGDSAGASLTSIYATAACREEIRDALNTGPTVPVEDIRGLILFYGAFDFETMLSTGFPLIKSLAFSFVGDDAEEYTRLAELISPTRNITPDYPPTFIVSGGRDHLHSESVDLSQALERAGVTHEESFFPRASYPEAFHGFANLFFLRCTDEATRGALEFMHANDKVRQERTAG